MLGRPLELGGAAGGRPGSFRQDKAQPGLGSGRGDGSRGLPGDGVDGVAGRRHPGEPRVLAGDPGWMEIVPSEVGTAGGGRSFWKKCLNMFTFCFIHYHPVKLTFGGAVL